MGTNDAIRITGCKMNTVISTAVAVMITYDKLSTIMVQLLLLGSQSVNWKRRVIQLLVLAS